MAPATRWRRTAKGVPIFWRQRRHFSTLRVPPNQKRGTKVTVFLQQLPAAIILIVLFVRRCTRVQIQYAPFSNIYICIYILG